MAATEKKQIWFYSSDDNLAPNIVRGLIAASQGIMMPGAPLYRSTSGTWKLCDTADGSDAWHGFLMNTISAEMAANTEIRIALIQRRCTYAVFTENNGTDSAIAQSNVGNQYGLTVSATSGQVGYTTLDLNNGHGIVDVVDIMSNLESIKFTTSDAPGVSLVKFTDAVIAATKA